MAAPLYSCIYYTDTFIIDNKYKTFCLKCEIIKLNYWNKKLLQSFVAMDLLSYLLLNRDQ